jgi:glycosyltransferase involved in cell wall biosynthesis
MISVIIPTHNRSALLSTSLTAILADHATEEVIVVLDGCTDDTDEVVERMRSRDARIKSIVLWPNVGPVEARLVGVQAANNSIVLCVDDDVILENGCVSGHARHHAEQDADVIVGYMPVAFADRKRSATQQRYASMYESLTREWTRNPDSILLSLWGGNVSCSRDAYIKASSLCDKTLRFHEDQELGFVLKEMGSSALFDRNLRAAHLYERGIDAVLRDSSRSGASYAYFAAKYADLFPEAKSAFQAELRNPLRRLLIGAAATPRVSHFLVRLFTTFDKPTPAMQWCAGEVLRVLTRAYRYQGFRSGSVAEELR